MARPSYRVPAPVLRRLGLAMLGRGTVSLTDDCADYVAAARPAPLVTGAESIPRQGTFCAIANHCERRGLWIGFPSALLVTTVARRRPGASPLHFAVVDQTRLWHGRLPVPGTAWAYRRVADRYGMVTLPVRPAATVARAAALRRLARLAMPPPGGRGEPVCLYPEGEHATARGLSEALPGTGAFLLLLSRAGVPLLPVGFAEEGERLACRIGPLFRIAIDTAMPAEDRDRAARTEAMSRVAALLPAHLRGSYGSPG